MKTFFCVSLLLFCTACSTSPSSQSGYGGDDGDVVSYAKSLLGTPYYYGGDSPRTGFDCSGFVRHVFHHARGVELPHNALGISRAGTAIKAIQLRPGDLVFYNTLRTPYSHVGIYLGNARFIHSPSSGKGVEIVDMNMNYWKDRYNGARRIR